MEIATQVAAKLHLIAAMYWTGAILFLALVATPIMNLVRPPSFQREISRRLWRMAHGSMWIAISVLVASGLFIMFRAGQLNASMLSRGFLLSTMGEKLLISSFMIGLSLLHDFYIGPGARLRDPKASTDPPGFVARLIPWLVGAGAIAATLLSVMLRE